MQQQQRYCQNRYSGEKISSRKEMFQFLGKKVDSIYRFGRKKVILWTPINSLHYSTMQNDFKNKKDLWRQDLKMTLPPCGLWLFWAGFNYQGMMRKIFSMEDSELQIFNCFFSIFTFKFFWLPILFLSKIAKMDLIFVILTL